MIATPASCPPGMVLVQGEEFIVNWFHLDEYGWKVNFSD